MGYVNREYGTLIVTGLQAVVNTTGIYYIGCYRGEADSGIIQRRLIMPRTYMNIYRGMANMWQREGLSEILP